jgi:hypothetical protein
MVAPASSRGAWLLPLDSSAAHASRFFLVLVDHQCWSVWTRKR